MGFGLRVWGLRVLGLGESPKHEIKMQCNLWRAATAEDSTPVVAMMR